MGCELQYKVYGPDAYAVELRGIDGQHIETVSRQASLTQAMRLGHWYAMQQGCDFCGEED